MSDRARRVTMAGDGARPTFPLSIEDASKAYGSEIPSEVWEGIQLEWDRWHALAPYAAAPRDTKNRNDPNRYEMLQKRLAKKLRKALRLINAGKVDQAELCVSEALNDHLAIQAIQGSLDANHGDCSNRDLAEMVQAAWDAIRAVVYSGRVDLLATAENLLERSLTDVERAFAHSIRYNTAMARDRFIRGIWRALSNAGLEPKLSHFRDEEITDAEIHRLSNFERLVYNLDVTNTESPRNEIWLIFKAIKAD